MVSSQILREKVCLASRLGSCARLLTLLRREAVSPHRIDGNHNGDHEQDRDQLESVSLSLPAAPN